MVYMARVGLERERVYMGSSMGGVGWMVVGWIQGYKDILLLRPVYKYSVPIRQI